MNTKQITQAIKNGHALSMDEALEVLNNTTLSDIAQAADEIRRHFCGDTMDLCSIINARSGRCSEDCKWCSQSQFHSTGISEYEMIDPKEAVEQATANRQEGVNRFSLVTSGRTVSNRQLQRYISVYHEIASKSDISLCASMGLLNREQLKQLKEAGVQHYHCNIETAPSFFPNLCTTHTMEEKLQTIRWAQAEGLKICSGGIIGMGESMTQRIEMAITLRELGAESIPVNILMPIKGTPLEKAPSISDDEIIATLALFRLINPTARIRFAGGRQQISHRQKEALQAGVNAALVGNYLTTIGANSISEDKTNFKAAGFRFIP